nr:hypothetical protein CFP56_16216 [Quercus suber]
MNLVSRLLSSSGEGGTVRANDEKRGTQSVIGEETSVMEMKLDTEEQQKRRDEESWWESRDHNSIFGQFIKLITVTTAAETVPLHLVYYRIGIYSIYAYSLTIYGTCTALDDCPASHYRLYNLVAFECRNVL